MRNCGKWSVRTDGCGSIHPHSAFCTPHSKGFTLIEIIIVIVILGILSTVAAMIILEGAKSYSIEDQRSDVHYQARLAVERMAREIRTIRQPADLGTTVIGTITGNPTNSLIFIDITGTAITYALTGTDLNRTVGGVPSRLASNVSSLQFRHYNNAVPPVATTTPTAVWFIDVSITAQQGTETLNMSTRVHPMNF